MKQNAISLLTYIQYNDVDPVIYKYFISKNGIDAYYAFGTTLIFNVRSTEIADWLLSLGVNIHHKTYIGRSVLHSVSTGEMIDWFNKHSVDINVTDNDGKNALFIMDEPIIITTEKDIMNKAKMLISNSIDINYRDNGM